VPPEWTPNSYAQVLAGLKRRRGFEYLRANAPAFFEVRTGPAFEVTVIGLVTPQSLHLTLSRRRFVRKEWLGAWLGGPFGQLSTGALAGRAAVSRSCSQQGSAQKPILQTVLSGERGEAKCQRYCARVHCEDESRNAPDLFRSSSAD
jgi:hypothetical protein